MYKKKKQEMTMHKNRQMANMVPIFCGSLIFRMNFGNVIS